VLLKQMFFLRISKSARQVVRHRWVTAYGPPVSPTPYISTRPMPVEPSPLETIAV
jgi:hypothetical protein